MIRVEPAREPPSFHENVRLRGLDAIAELCGEAASRARPGPRRARIADTREAIPADAYPPFWRDALDDMLAGYHRICAYSCLYIEHVTGGATVDHMLPRSTHWRHVYEWNNYRLACALMNSRKADAADVLDPFEVEEGWFAMELDDCQVIPGAGLDRAVAARVEAAISRLRLNDEDCSRARREYVDAYLDGDISLRRLTQRAPFIARELRRQGRLREGDR